MKDKDIFNQTITNKVKTLRKQRNLNQDEFCKLMNVSKNVLSNLERGITNWDAYEVNQAANALDVSPMVLMGIDEKEINLSIMRKLRDFSKRDLELVEGLINSLHEKYE